MKSYNQWTGSKAELHSVIDYVIRKMQEDLDIDLSEADMRKLFLEALCRNLVLSELKEMIVYILDEEGDFPNE